MQKKIKYFSIHSTTIKAHTKEKYIVSERNQQP